MLDELAIYNLSVKYPNTIDLVREVERTAKAEAFDDCIALARAEIDFESQSEQKRFVEFMEQLKEQKNDG